MRDARPSAGAGSAFWSWVYNALWYPVLPLVLLAAGGDARGRRERLGRIVHQSNRAADAVRVWVHGASAGEIEGVRPVVRELRRTMPALDFTITAMTPAGREAARRRIGAHCQLAPFDHVKAVRAFLTHLRPRLLIVTETELWPNFFLQSAQAGVRIAIINGRLSPRSMTSYRRIRPLLTPVLRSADQVLVQTEEDAERFRELGALSERVVVTGNSKYELDETAPPLAPALADFASGRPILIAGSTAAGEEHTVLIAYQRLRKRFPTLALIVAPRHLARVAQAESELRNAGLSYMRRSCLNPADHQGAVAQTSVLLLDTMGELRGLYQRAAIAFVGGSLSAGRGGQSLAEPASASVPMLFGPHFENHRQLGHRLLQAGGGRLINNAVELEHACAQWLLEPSARRTAGERARRVMEQLAGSALVTVRHLTGLLAAA